MDPYLNMELGLPRGENDELDLGCVIKRSCDDNGNPIRQAHSNPFLDSGQYEVAFEDGTTELLTANIRAENLLSQVDEEGRQQMMLDEVIHHRKSEDAIPKSKGTYLMQRGFSRKVGRFACVGKMVPPTG